MTKDKTNIEEIVRNIADPIHPQIVVDGCVSAIKDQVQIELENYFGHLLNDGSGKPMQKSLEQVADEVIDLFRVKKEQREHE